MAFATLAEFKTQLNFPSTDTSKDTELQVYLDSANSQVEWMIGPSSSTAKTERLYSNHSRILTNFRPIISITSVTAAEFAWPVNLSECVIEHDQGVIRRINGWRFQGWYDIVYQYGWASVTADQKLAALIIAQHLWQLQNGRGRAASGDDLVGSGLGFSIPNRAMELLRRYSPPSVVTGIG